MQMTGRFKEQWGELTNDEVDQIAGKRDRLVGSVQEKHGITKEAAESANSMNGASRHTMPAREHRHHSDRRCRPACHGPHVIRSINLAMAVALSLAVGVVVMAFWHGDVAAIDQTHTTNIAKNQIWPVKGPVAVDPCDASACLTV